MTLLHPPAASQGQPDTGDPRDGGLAARLPVARLLGCAVALVVAAPLTLYTAWTEWEFSSPMAELAMVPLMAAVVAVGVAVRYPHVATARLGRPDWWVAGTALAVLALLQLWMLVLPGSYVWVLRPDALTLPAMGLAALALFFGMRGLVVFYPAVALLLLAWPLPAAGLLELLSAPMTRLTGFLVQAAVAVVPLAERVPSNGSDAVLAVAHGSTTFQVQVSSACAGLGGMLGVLVVGTGLLYFFEGRLRSRLSWLAAAVVVAYTANVLRILLLLLVGRLFGEDAALGLFHSYAGLLLLNLVFLLMITQARRFGLRRRVLTGARSDNPLHAVTRGGPRHTRALRRRAVALLLMATTLGAINLQFAQAAPAYRNQDLVAVQSLSETLTAQARQGEVRALGEATWARKYFGDDSRWTRFEMFSDDPSRPTTWVDVIDTDSVGALRAHSVLRCYDMHEQEVLARRRVELDSGVNVDVFVVQMSKGVWHAVSWERPIQRGDKIGHERVTLMASSIQSPIAGGFRQPGADDLRGRLLSGFNTILPDEDPNPEVSASLLALANDIENEQLQAADSRRS